MRQWKKIVYFHFIGAPCSSINSVIIGIPDNSHVHTKHSSCVVRIATCKFVYNSVVMRDKHRKIILVLSLITAMLICLTSFVGLFLPEFYEAESTEWQIQCKAQDFINLVVIMPPFILMTFLSFSGKGFASLIRAGCLLYMIYTYLIYCFDIHFNLFFITYCIILGLSFYLLLHFFYSYRHVSNSPKWPVVKLTAIYFLILPVVFCVFWLSEIIPAAINFTQPASVGEPGLFTNPVHVLDLSFLLPGVFMTGVMLLQKKRLAFMLTPVFLTFFILMDATIVILTLLMVWRGAITSYAVIWLMTALAVFSLSLLIYNLRPKTI
jgi:hypothetical protein